MYYAFGDCVLDTQRYVLHRAGQPVRLRPKVFQLLVYLLAERDRVVTKQELSEQVWRGQCISDATLESTLAAVRRALTLATAGGDAVLQARVNRALGIAYRAQGAYRRAIDCFGQTMLSPKGTQRRVGFGGVILPAVHSRASLAVCHAELSTFSEGRPSGERGIK
jgi:hypothetical protein